MEFLELGQFLLFALANRWGTDPITESVMVNFGALYDHVGVLATSTEVSLRFEATAIQLHVGCDERHFLSRAGFHEEQTAVLDTREMIHVLRRTPSRPAIDPLAFDKVVAEKLWHKHREQDSRLTKNQVRRPCRWS